jgi:hypothetical protein
MIGNIKAVALPAMLRGINSFMSDVGQQIETA